MPDKLTGTFCRSVAPPGEDKNLRRGNRAAVASPGSQVERREVVVPATQHRRQPRQPGPPRLYRRRALGRAFRLVRASKTDLRRGPTHVRLSIELNRCQRREDHGRAR